MTIVRPTVSSFFFTTLRRLKGSRFDLVVFFFYISFYY